MNAFMSRIWAPMLLIGSMGACASQPVKSAGNVESSQSPQITGNQDSYTAPAEQARHFPSLDLEKVKRGEAKISIEIPTHDDTEQSIRDFMQFCRERGLKCAYDTHGRTYSPWKGPSPTDSIDLMTIEGSAKKYCRPEAGYTINASFQPDSDHSQTSPSPLRERATSLYAESINGITVPCETHSHAFCEWNSTGVTLHELLRIIMQHPELLEVIKQKKEIVATGSFAVPTLPKDQIDETLRTQKTEVPGKAYWYILNEDPLLDCETGEMTYIRRPVPQRMVHFVSHKSGKDDWHNLGIMEVIIRWEESSQTFRITYGKPYGLHGG